MTLGPAGPSATPAEGGATPRAGRARDATLSRWAGAILLVGAAQFIVEMAVEQAFWPSSWPSGREYSGCTSPFDPLTNAISDLGGHCALGLGIAFDASVFVVGIAALGGAILLWRVLPRRRSLRIGTVLLMLAGAGAMGVGIWPEFHPTPHGISAFFAFFFGGLGLIALGRGLAKTGDGRTFSLLTSLGGVVDLVSIFLFLGSDAIAPGLSGLFERMIVAPVLLWAMGYGLRLLRGTAPVFGPGTARPAPQSA